MNSFLAAAMRGEEPALADWYEHLREFHRAFPDATELPISTLRSQSGDTSYQRFAAFVRAGAPHARTVLDVGCGRGALLGELARAYGGHLRLHGIDLCESESAAARCRIPESRVVTGDLFEAPYADGAFDLIVGHLTFPLIPDADALFARLRSLLVEGGMLAFATEDLTQGSFMPLIASSLAAVHERFPSFAPRIPGRKPFDDDAVLRAVLRRAAFAGEPVIERVSYHANLSGPALRSIVHRAYPFGLLPAAVLVDVDRAIERVTNGRPYDLSLTLRMTSICR